MADELSKLKVLPWESNSNGKRKQRTRLGRGEGSGKGTTAGRGQKGQMSRSGSGRRWGFEGGQMPLHRRLPKKGFTNIFAKDFEVLNVSKLAGLAAGSVVTAETLREAGIISRIGKDGVKVLGGGDLEVALHVRVAKLSASAAEKIVAAGGTIEGDLP
ncbi:MAG: 50S ribosomal protein L15 [Deltaproteobacteria bacterium]|nr:MAG: 50S ribosomal protein L15 [Deltaproteobacteria bacterium]